MTITSVQNLNKFFVPTRLDKYGEIRKAEIKNYNLPILQYWFNGNPETELKCLVSNTFGFLDFPNIVTGDARQRFTIDFNHIRQKSSVSCRSGISVDKLKYDPSHLFRTYYLDQERYKISLIEIMTTIPINTLYHKFISNDSAKSDITLLNFKQEWWPWGLKNKENFDLFCKKYHLNLDYNKFISLLSDINIPCVQYSYTDGQLST